MLVSLRVCLRSMIDDMLDTIHDPWARLLPDDPGGEAKVSEVASDVADAGGLEELDVPLGGDGDEDAFKGERLAAGPEFFEAALDLLGRVAVPRPGVGARVQISAGARTHIGEVTPCNTCTVDDEDALLTRTRP